MTICRPLNSNTETDIARWRSGFRVQPRRDRLVRRKSSSQAIVRAFRSKKVKLSTIVNNSARLPGPLRC